jgi:NAD(P)-dependent dehydrogenase (short-subunit alcohol dehydrogenase family)
MSQHVLVTGGAGYVGAVLVPKLLARDYRVAVLDLYIFGDQVLKAVSGHPRLREVKGDIRDRRLLERELTGVDAVIHLACISNDPSFELNPELGKSINYDAFFPLVEISMTDLYVRSLEWPEERIDGQIFNAGYENQDPYYTPLLKAPIKRVALPDVPTPGSSALESAYYPGPGAIVAAVKQCLEAPSSAVADPVAPSSRKEFEGPF